MSDVTRILSQIEQGNPKAAEKLLPLVYDELRKLADVKRVLPATVQFLIWPPARFEAESAASGSMHSSVLAGSKLIEHSAAISFGCFQPFAVVT